MFSWPSPQALKAQRHLFSKDKNHLDFLIKTQDKILYDLKTAQFNF